MSAYEVLSSIGHFIHVQLKAAYITKIAVERGSYPVIKEGIAIDLGHGAILGMEGFWNVHSFFYRNVVREIKIYRKK